MLSRSRRKRFRGGRGGIFGNFPEQVGGPWEKGGTAEVKTGNLGKLCSVSLKQNSQKPLKCGVATIEEEEKDRQKVKSECSKNKSFVIG